MPGRPRYGVPSDRLADAFGTVAVNLVETADFHARRQTYDAWRHLGARSTEVRIYVGYCGRMVVRDRPPFPAPPAF